MELVRDLPRGLWVDATVTSCVPFSVHESAITIVGTQKILIRKINCKKLKLTHKGVLACIENGACNRKDVKDTKF